MTNDIIDIYCNASHFMKKKDLYRSRIGIKILNQSLFIKKSFIHTKHVM